MKLEDTKDPVPGKGEVFVKIHAAGSTVWQKNGVALITGASSGIGSTYSERLARRLKSP